jgi:hypothetical protein
MAKRSIRKSKSVPPVAPAAVAAPVVAPTHEAIARRAYELYLQRGATHGCDLLDWIAAERELTTHAA